MHTTAQYICEGLPWLNRRSSCATQVYKLDAYADARGFNDEYRKNASRVRYPCRLTVVYQNGPPLNLASRESTINQHICEAANARLSNFY